MIKLYGLYAKTTQMKLSIPRLTSLWQQLQVAYSCLTIRSINMSNSSIEWWSSIQKHWAQQLLLNKEIVRRITQSKIVLRRRGISSPLHSPLGIAKLGLKSSYSYLWLQKSGPSTREMQNLYLSAFKWCI